MSEITDKLDEMAAYAIEHARILQHHLDFGRMYSRLRSLVEAQDRVVERSEAAVMAGNALFQFGLRHDFDCATRLDGACTCGLDDLCHKFLQAFDAWQREENTLKEMAKR